MENNKLPFHLNSGFKVPKDYFENFEERLMHAVNQDDPSGIIPTYSRKSGFTIPEDYFETLENRILDQLEKDPVKVIPLFPVRKLFYAAAVAAVFIGVIITTYFNNDTSVYSIDSVELSVLEKYIEEGYFDLNFYELSTFMTDEHYSYGDYSKLNLSEEALYNYINENIEDPELLYE